MLQYCVCSTLAMHLSLQAHLPHKCGCSALCAVCFRVTGWPTFVYLAPAQASASLELSPVQQTAAAAAVQQQQQYSSSSSAAAACISA
jgi:hypothetical protein